MKITKCISHPTFGISCSYRDNKTTCKRCFYPFTKVCPAAIEKEVDEAACNICPFKFECWTK